MAALHCVCACHIGAPSVASIFCGVSVSDPVEAAVACDHCRHLHCPALLDKPPVLPVERMQPPYIADATRVERERG